MVIKIFLPCEIEDFFDIEACLGTHLVVRKTCFFNFGLDLFFADLSMVFEVGFISEEYKYSFLFFVIVAEIDPFVQIFKWFLVSNYRVMYS